MIRTTSQGHIRKLHVSGFLASQRPTPNATAKEVALTLEIEQTGDCRERSVRIQTRKMLANRGDRLWVYAKLNTQYSNTQYA